MSGIPRRTRIASYVLIEREQQLLMCRLSAHTAERGSWTLPGGGVEFGEHPEQTAVRETFEETGYHVRTLELLSLDSCVIELPRADLHCLRFLFRAEITGGEQVNEQRGSTDQCGWFTKENCQSLSLARMAKIGVNLCFPDCGS